MRSAQICIAMLVVAVILSGCHDRSSVTNTITLASNGILGEVVSDSMEATYPELGDVFLIHGEPSTNNCGVMLVGPSLGLTDWHCFQNENTGRQTSDSFSFYKHDLPAPFELDGYPIAHPLFGPWLIVRTEGASVRLHDYDVAALKFKSSLYYAPLRRQKHTPVTGDSILLLGFCNARTGAIFETPMWIKTVIADVGEKLVLVKTDYSSTCVGDSGSPAFVILPDHELQFIGLTSAVYDETSPAQQTTFITRVNLEQLPWKDFATVFRADN